MKLQQIALDQLQPHGKVTAKFTVPTLSFTTQMQNYRFYAEGMPLNSYLVVPGTYRLPLKVDMVAKIDNSSLYLVLGKGHVTLGTSFLDNRRIGDILEPDPKKTAVFPNDLEMNIFHQITVFYGHDFFQICIDGEERYFSKKEKYIKSRLLEAANKEGFAFKIAGSKHTCVTISSLSVTEFEKDEPSGLLDGKKEENAPKINCSIDKKAKSDFESCIAGLPADLQKEVRAIDLELLNHKNLKVKRKIEGTKEACKITYVSSHGFSYALRINNAILDHSFWWYMVSNYKYQDHYMGRKNDLTGEMLLRVKSFSPTAAGRLFDYYDECVGCTARCQARTVYEFDGMKKQTCHGKMIMNMNEETFQNIRLLFRLWKAFGVKLCDAAFMFFQC